MLSGTGLTGWRCAQRGGQRAVERAGQRAVQRGLTMIELMVGVTLGLMVTGALMTLLANASPNGQNLQRSSVQIENARYAAELLRDDLRLAGFFGELETQSAAWTTPDPCAITAAGWAASPLSLPTPVRGYGATEALGCLAQRRAGTHALALRRLEVFTQPAAGLGAGNTQDFVQVSFCNADPPTQPLVVGRDPSLLTLRNRACNAVNPVRPLVSRIYYVATCNRCGTGGDDTPTLKRVDLVGGALVETALVEGVETLRLEYGFDTDGDGSVDEYRLTTAASGAGSRWENVMALKLHLVMRSTDRALGNSAPGTQRFVLGGTGSLDAPADGYVRRAFSTTVRLVNPSGVRELQ